jgi:anti-anti-sigma regulatory factor
LLHYRGDMFKICRSSSGRWVLFSVSGRIDGEAVSELKSLLGRESAGSKLLLDLEEVRIVDAEAVEFFARCEDAGIRLRKCPPYVQEWIASNRRQS